MTISLLCIFSFNVSGFAIKHSDNGVAPYLSTNRSFWVLGSLSISSFIFLYSASVFATLIAPIGHSFSHLPHEIHFSLSI